MRFANENYTQEGAIRGLRLFSIAFERMMIFVVPAGVIEIRFADSGMAVDALLVFFLRVFRSSGRERHEKNADG